MDSWLHFILAGPDFYHVNIDYDCFVCQLMDIRLKKWILFNFVGPRRMNITIFLFTNILKFHMVTAHPSMPLFQKFSNFQYVSAQNTLFNLRKPQKIIQWANYGWKLIWMFMVTVHPFLTRSQFFFKKWKVG